MDQPSHTMPSYQYYSDKDAFVYCFKSAKNDSPPFIANIKQTEGSISYAVTDCCDDSAPNRPFGAFGHSWIFWFDESGILLKSPGGTHQFYNYEPFATGNCTKLHGANSASLDLLEVFQLDIV